MRVNRAPRSSRAILLVAATTAIAGAGTAQAAGPVAKVTASFTYVPVEVGRAITIDAQGTDPVRGTWTWQALPDGLILSGPVTCLVIDGDEAFVFGPAKVGGRAAFMWVVDGGGPGGGDDAAIAWIQDLPGDDLPKGVKPQTLDEMEGWCRNKGRGFPKELGPIDLTTGNITIHEGR